MTLLADPQADRRLAERKNKVNRRLSADNNATGVCCLHYEIFPRPAATNPILKFWGLSPKLIILRIDKKFLLTPRSVLE